MNIPVPERSVQEELDRLRAELTDARNIIETLDGHVADTAADLLAQLAEVERLRVLVERLRFEADRDRIKLQREHSRKLRDLRVAIQALLRGAKA